MPTPPRAIPVPTPQCVGAPQALRLAAPLLAVLLLAPAAYAQSRHAAGSPAQDAVVEAAIASGADAATARALAQAAVPTFEEVTRLTDPAGAAGDGAGTTVSFSGDRALVGAPFRGTNGDRSGSAYVFVRAGTTWTLEAELVADDGGLPGAAGDAFGTAVALDGERALVGSPDDSNTGLDKGSAYVFVRTGTTWTQEAHLTASDGAEDDQFGHAVALSGDRALIGALGDDGYAGAAYVFAYAGAAWTEEARLVAPVRAEFDQFGSSVALLGDRALVGALGVDEGAGAAYVFLGDGTGWGLETPLAAAGVAEASGFGSAVALFGDRALVGARFDDGAAYVFLREASGWAQEAELTPDDLQGDGFGFAVALTDDRALVGAPLDSDNGFFSGSAYVFARSGTTWSREMELTPSDASRDDRFGTSVVLTDDFALVGAPSADNGGGVSSGAAYVFAAIPPPVASVAPASVTVAVPEGGTDTRTLTVANDAAAGAQALTYEISLLETTPGVRGGDPAADAFGGAAPCTDGQRLDQTVWNVLSAMRTGGQEMGQSFTAPCTGRLDELVVGLYYSSGTSPNTTWEATLYVYEGEGTSGTVLASRAFSHTNGASGSGTVTVPLAAPLPITEGQVYTWFVDMTAGETSARFSSSDDPLAGGARYRTLNGDPGSATPQEGSDLYFSAGLLAPLWVAPDVYRGTVPPGASADVTLTFDPAGRAAGTYTADLLLASNDPVTPTITVPLVLQVGEGGGTTVTISGGPGWRMLSAPVAGMTVADLAAQNLVQGVPGYYPEAGANLLTGYSGAGAAGFSAPAGGGDVLASGRGFFWYLYDADFDPGGPSQSHALPFALTAAGTEVATDVAVGLHAAGDGFNLVGNPFAAALDVSGMAAWAQGGALASAVGQVWDPAGESYVLTSDPASGDRVALWQGFFVENDDAASLVIPASARTTGGVFYRGGEASPLLAFALAGATAAGAPTLDRAAILALHPDADAGWDLRDASKLTPPAAAYALVAFVGERDGEPVAKAQESRALVPAGAFEVGLAVEAVGTEGPLVLSWPSDALPPGWRLTLRDVATGAVVDLRADSAYAFVVEGGAPVGRPGDGTGGGTSSPVAPVVSRVAPSAVRFVLRVEPAAVVAGASGPGMPEALALSLYPNPARGAVRLALAVPATGVVAAVVYDVLGREVVRLHDGPLAAGTHALTLDAAALPAGVYVVRAGWGEDVVTRRLTVVR